MRVLACLSFAFFLAAGCSSEAPAEQPPGGQASAGGGQGGDGGGSGASAGAPGGEGGSSGAEASGGQAAGGQDSAGAGGIGQGGAGAGGAAPVCGDSVKSGAEECDGEVIGQNCVSLDAGGLPPGPDGAPLSMGGLGQPVCAQDCSIDTGLCDPSVRSIGYLDTSSPGGEAQFLENFAWDPVARVYRTTGVQRSVLLPVGTPLPLGATFLAFASEDTPLTLPAGAKLPDYPFLRVDSEGTAAPLYDPCWDYDCTLPLPPRKQLPARRAPLMLRNTGGDAHVPGTGKPWVEGKGKIRLVMAVVYAESPMPDEAIGQLFAPEGTADSTSLLAVPPWFAARSKELALPSPVEVEWVWSKVQIKLPPDQVPQDYNQCASADWKPLLAPSVDLSPSDVLVQFYWGTDGVQCANHVLWSSRSFVLFAHPTFFALPGLVVSGAHELMHLFGATDKYTETIAPGSDGKPHGCWFDDSSDYNAHDIMCHRVATSGPDGTITGFEHPPLHQLVVSPLTAREVGWHDMDGDGTVEIDDACPWDGGC